MHAELQSLDSIESESVDAVISVTVLTHIFDPELVLSEFHRVLKPGGVVVADFAIVDDSTYDTVQENGDVLGHNVFLEEGTNVKYWERPSDVEALFYEYTDVSVDEVEFDETPHPDSRPYEHTHTSYLVTAKK